MKIGRDEVLHVARLAELAVAEEDLARLVGQLNAIVEYVAQLDALHRLRLPALRGRGHEVALEAPATERGSTALARPSSASSTRCHSATASGRGSDTAP